MRRDSSLCRPTGSRERTSEKEPACSARNDIFSDPLTNSFPGATLSQFVWYEGLSRDALRGRPQGPGSASCAAARDAHRKRPRHPLGANVENQGIAQRFVKVNADAAGLGTRRLQKKLQFFAKLLLFPRNGFETNKGVQGQSKLPAEYSLQGGRSDGAPSANPSKMSGLSKQGNLVLCDGGRRGRVSGDSMK